MTSISTYEKRVRPLRNTSQPMYVKISFFPRSLVELNDERQRIAMAAYMDMYWNDEYIRWNPAEYEGVSRIVLTDQDIWKPDIMLVDSQGGINDVSYTMGNIELVVWFDGNVTWYSNRVFVRSCNLDMTFFPYDLQKCFFRFESKTQDRKSLTLGVEDTSGGIEPITLDVINQSGDGQWDFVKAVAGIHVEPYLDWSYYKVTFTMKRKPLYFLMNILGPCIVISLLIPVMFYLPPDSGEKISMGVTVLLAFSVFQLVIADTLPKTSDSTPIIVIYIMVLMALSALSIVLSVVVLHLHLNGDTTIPKWLQVLVFDCLARVLCMHESAKKMSINKSEFDLFYENTENSDLPWSNKNDDVQLSSVARKGDKNRNGFRGNHSMATQSAPLSADQQYISNIETILNRILFSLNGYMILKKEKVSKKELREQWITLAKILDRFFMLNYFIINIVAAAVFFGIFGH